MEGNSRLRAVWDSLSPQEEHCRSLTADRLHELLNAETARARYIFCFNLSTCRASGWEV
jgi:hypothetical protein